MRIHKMKALHWNVKYRNFDFEFDGASDFKEQISCVNYKSWFLLFPKYSLNQLKVKNSSPNF